jgi:spore germination cell wall hydrolase CwlJ-like protein
VKNITAPGEKMEDPDMMLMAKIVQCEAENQGYNGWVAVAQVIKNRIRSDGFEGNNVREIVSAPGQFATYNKAMGMSDSEVNPDILAACEKVMAGEVRVIDDDVISFKRDIGET